MIEAMQDDLREMLPKVLDDTGIRDEGSPRFANGQCENDKSEIRHFPHRYFSIGHVLATGLVIPGRKATRGSAQHDRTALAIFSIRCS